MEYSKGSADISISEDYSEDTTFDIDKNYTDEVNNVSDTENEEDDREENEDNGPNFLGGLDVDYMAEAMKTLEDHAEVGTDNAIVLNRKMQDMIEKLRDKVISMLNKCRQQYLANQEKLLHPASRATLLGGIGSCGAPFFKDACGRLCPPNSDYLYRSEVEKELFPGDLDHYPHFVWTATDKLGILQGVKEQAIEYIERKQSYPSTSKCQNSSKLNKNVKLHTLKLAELLSGVDEEFSIDWNQISVYNLKSRHTATSCYAIWNVYLKPEINRGQWTEEENVKLNILAKKHKFQDWIAIAAEMNGRSDYQCFVQYQTVVSVQMREDKGERWTKEEDELLLSLVEKHRMGNVIRWNPICSQLPNRSKGQCFSRYMYSINPSILRAPFTPEEDCIILAAVAEYGENFNVFPKSLFPNRTVIQIRNRYYNSIKVREKTRFWTPADDKTLLQLVAKYGNHDWKRIADEIQTHSRTSCRTRFLVISKFLKENPNASINDLPRKKRGPVSTVTQENWMKKIAEIKENPIPLRTVKEPRKELYRFRLRNNELKWYNWLKYAYDFRYFKSFSRVSDSVVGLEFARSALDVELKLPVVLHKPYSSGAVRVNLEKLIRTRSEGDKPVIAELPQPGYRLPASYCTLLGFRGLCILTSSCKEQGISPSNDSDAVRVAKEKFRQRLATIMYNTTLLSRLDPDDVVEKSNFEVVFDPNTSLGRAASRSLAELRVAQTNAIAENIAIATRKAKRKSTADGHNPAKKKIRKHAGQ